MNNPSIFVIVPPSTIQQALAEAEARLAGSSDYAPTWNISLPPNGVSARMEAVLGNKPLIAYRVTFSPLDALVCVNALTEPLVHAPAVAHLEVAKAAIQQRYDADACNIDEVGLGDCTFETQQVMYVWEQESPKAAARLWLDVLNHCVVCLDAIDVDVGRDHKGQISPRQRPRVKLDGQDRWVFELRLTWGRVQVRLAGMNPPALHRVPSEDRPAVREALSRLLVVTVEIDVEKFNARFQASPLQSGESWISRDGEHPMKFVLDQLRWDLWLDTSLARSADEVDLKALTNNRHVEVVQAHMAGRSVRSIPPLTADTEFEKFRNQLVDLVGVDIAVPFHIAQHNLSTELGEALQWKALFDLDACPVLEPVCLSKANAQEQLNALITAVASPKEN